MAVPKRVGDRIKSGVRKFRSVLRNARDADLSEQDTSTIVCDILAEMGGFDKYTEITGQYAIRGTFCDLAIKVDDRLKCLIEVKAADKGLRESHLRQATDYAAKEGVDWGILTNGIEWEVHRMYFEQPVRHENLFTINLVDGDASVLVEQFYMVSREGILNNALNEFQQAKAAANRYTIASVILHEDGLRFVRRELRKAFPDAKVDTDEIGNILRAEVIKREVIESDELKEAERKKRRADRRRERSTKKKQQASGQEISKKGLTPEITPPHLQDENLGASDGAPA